MRIILIILIFSFTMLIGWWWFINRYKTRENTAQANDHSDKTGSQPGNSVPNKNNGYYCNESQRLTYVNLHNQITNIIALLKSTHLSKFDFKNKWCRYFNKNAAVYALPWIMVIGPSESGKSTLIKQSQLHFPLTNCVNASDINSLVEEHPVHSEWILAETGVLIDSCGDYLDDKNYLFEWFSLLKLLKKYRRRLPLNGIVLTIDFSAIIIADDNAMKKWANILRERLADIAKILGYLLPIYIIFTKMDHLSGFVEYFADWTDHRREQAWGISLYSAAQYAQRIALLNKQMQLLYHKLLQWRINKIARSENLQKRLAIFNFPEQFRAATPAILSFLRLLLKENPYQETPLFAGVYFSSSTQTCFIKKTFSEIVFTPQSITLKNHHSLRRRQWLKSIILISASSVTIGLCILFGTAMARNSELLQQGVQNVADYYASVQLHINYQRLQQNIEDFSIQQNGRLKSNNDVNNQRVAQSAQFQLDAINQLLPLLNYYRRLESFTTIPGYLHLGLYRGNLLIPDIHYFMQQNVNRLFLQPTAHLLEAQLQDDTLRWSQDNEMQREQLRGEYYSLLEVYLMVCFPHLLDNHVAVGILYQLWQPLLKTQQMLSPTIINYFMQIAADQLHWQVNHQLVSTARAQLNTAAANNIYAEIRSAAMTQLGYTSLAELLNTPNAHQLQSQYQLPILFTEQGWQQFAAAAIQHSARFATQEDWVIDEPLENFNQSNNSAVTDSVYVIVNHGDALNHVKPISSAQLTAQLQQLYFADYKQHWLTLLQSIQLSPFNSITDAAQQLQILASAQGPYAQLFHIIAENSDLTVDNTSKVVPFQKTYSILRFGNVNDGNLLLNKKSAQQTPNLFELRYLQQLTQVQNEIAQLASNPDLPLAAHQFAAHLLSNNKNMNDDNPVFNSSLSTVNMSESGANTENNNDYSENNRVSALYRSSLFCSMAGSQINDGASRQVISNLLLLPVRETWRVILNTVAQNLEQQWRVEVVNVFQQNLAHQQPFVRSGDDANSEDVAHFFQPNNGVFWQFYLSHIAPYIIANDDQYKERTWLNVRMGFSQPFLLALSQTQQITQGFFSQNNEQHPFANASVPLTSAQPQFTFEIFPIPTPGLDEIMLTTNGQTYRYRNEPQEWQKLNWPGNTPNNDTVLEIIAAQHQNHATLEINSLWGFFELLRHASITPVDKGTIRATWQLNSDDGHHYRVSMLVRMNNHADLFYLLTQRKYILPLICFL